MLDIVREFLSRMASDVLDPMMLERLTDHRKYARMLLNEARSNPKLKTSATFVTDVENDDELIAFVLNWLADGKPEKFYRDRGYEWRMLFDGSAVQRLALRIQMMDDLLQGFRSTETRMFDYHVFISHASEDKERFVAPLVDELVSLDCRVWYDEFALEIGDSLRQKIDLGLTRSRFGAVVLSPAFFGKNWTNYELNGLTAREMEGQRTILPIWYNVSKTDVLNYSPTLADKVALVATGMEIIDVALRLNKVVNKRV